MAYSEILYGVSNKIATVTLNRPEKLNAWTGVMEQEVRAALIEAADDENVGVIILTGSGRGFCSANFRLAGVYTRVVLGKHAGICQQKLFSCRKQIACVFLDR